jgi:hypothetical protein
VLRFGSRWLKPAQLVFQQYKVNEAKPPQTNKIKPKSKASLVEHAEAAELLMASK